MKKPLTSIKLHGVLGKAVGANWNIAVSSAAEAFRAIEILSKRKLFKFLYENDRRGIK